MGDVNGHFTELYTSLLTLIHRQNAKTGYFQNKSNKKPTLRAFDEASGERCVGWMRGMMRWSKIATEMRQIPLTRLRLISVCCGV